MKFKLLAAVLLIALFGCEKTVERTTAAEYVSGVYEAATHRLGGSAVTSYPINGQTIKLKITPVTSDQVRVEINSTVNGFYSPGNAVVFPSVNVLSTFCTTCQQTRTYRLELATPTNTGSFENVIWFDESMNAYYTYTPPNYTRGTVQTVFVREEK